MKSTMTNQSSRFIGNIPENYDTGLGPRIFFDYADELTSMVGDLNPGSVLELAAGTGIVTRRLRNSLPTDCTILAVELRSKLIQFGQIFAFLFSPLFTR